MKNLSNSPRHPYAQHIKHVSRIAMKIGLIVSIGLCILAFNWTTYDLAEDLPTPETFEMEKVVPVVRTTHKKRTPPPPVVEASTEILPDEDIEYNPEPEPKMVEDKVVVNEKVEPTEVTPAPVVEKRKAVPPAPLPVEKEPEIDIHVRVEEMPRFSGCENLKNDKEGRRLCADEKLLKFIYSNIKYPAIARTNDVEGLVVIEFVIAADGSIGNVKIVKDIGAGCGKEAARVIASMPDWIPGKQRNRKVAVRYNFPVKFRLK